MIKKASLLTACSVTAFSAWAQDTSPDTLVVTANRLLLTVLNNRAALCLRQLLL